MSHTLDPYSPRYTGAAVSQEFMDRWRSRRYVGKARPWARVSIRRGYMHHSLHTEWPGQHGPLWTRGLKTPQFGRVVGHPLNSQWFPDWTPTTDWITLPGVHEIDLDQQMNYASSGGNGITVATLTCDNQAWVEAMGDLGAYHTKQRGWLWPWRGWVPTNRPGGEVTDRNQWYNMLPNAQILIEQGWGEDTAIKTFTGLVDNPGPAGIRPDKITLTARDFGGTLVDRNPFGWNKDKRLNDPIVFLPPDYPRLKAIRTGKSHNWVVISDAVDIVKCALRWSGFKEWDIESSGVNLRVAYPVDRSKTWMDVINEVASQLGYVFFIAEPSDDDLSIGVPVFRKQAVLRKGPQPKLLDSSLMTDVQPAHDNTNDRFIIRVRGAIASRKKGGRPIVGGDMSIDGQIRYTFTYWPPWMPQMAGIIKQLTYYNIGSSGVLGFNSTRDCVVACVLIATQIALSRDTATVQCPGQPGVGLDSFTFINDRQASGIVSRLYVTSRKSTMTLGGDGSATGGNNAAGSSNDEMLWSTELTGSLVDNPEFDHIVKDYHIAVSGGKVQSTGGTGQWS